MVCELDLSIGGVSSMRVLWLTNEIFCSLWCWLRLAGPWEHEAARRHVCRERDLALLWTTHWNHLTRWPQPLHLFVLSARPLGAERNRFESRLSEWAVFVCFTFLPELEGQNKQTAVGKRHRNSSPYPFKSLSTERLRVVWVYVTYKAKVCVFVATAFWMEALKCLWRLYL